ncbi:MAG: DUF4416 family protein [Planctomycetes bacterium]|nr:DUF4416 family protein [Planctomycetota bacterium]
MLQVIAVTSRYDEALKAALEAEAECYGPVALVSEAYRFTETEYYTATMGPDLRKQFLAFQWLMDPGNLAYVKRQTNEWEALYASMGRHPEPRPVNLDPGYITPAKLVLASTKDHAHRIYLRDGIYAEITLTYRQRKWQPMEWTYPDYRRDDYQKFFTQCRDWLLNCSADGIAVK